jgi:hypothetical protein
MATLGMNYNFLLLASKNNLILEKVPLLTSHDYLMFHQGNRKQRWISVQLSSVSMVVCGWIC